MKIIDITSNDPTIYVGLLTETEKNKLIGQTFAPDSYFHSVQDINDNWFISIIQMMDCVNPDFLWVKDLDLIPYEPKPDILPNIDDAK
jgi:hypothetical protein